MNHWEIRQGDALQLLRAMPDNLVQTVVTSPPYWGLRDYGVAGQIGLEPTPEAYVARLVELFREVRRVLREDGTVWLNLGDCYAAGGRGGNSEASDTFHGNGPREEMAGKRKVAPPGLKPKDLVGIPWRVAFALQADGWWLRSDIIWSKPNPMPESTKDRPTRAHEYVFLLTKGERYYYDWRSIIEPFSDERMGCDGGTAESERNRGGRSDGLTKPSGIDPSANGGRNKRSVWTIASQPFPEAHFATFPEALVEPCILAGSRPRDLVLDPFAGSGTVGVVALRHGRRFLGLELNEKYVAMARRRIVGPLFAEVGA